MPNLSDASLRVGCNLSDASSRVGWNLWMVLENILLTLLLASIPSFSLMQCVFLVLVAQRQCQRGLACTGCQRGLACIGLTNQVPWSKSDSFSQIRLVSSTFLALFNDRHFKPAALGFPLEALF